MALRVALLVLVAERVLQHVIVDVAQLAVLEHDTSGQTEHEDRERLAAIGELDHGLLRRTVREEIDGDLSLRRALVAMLDPDLPELDPLVRAERANPRMRCRVLLDVAREALVDR